MEQPAKLKVTLCPQLGYKMLHQSIFRIVRCHQTKKRHHIWLLLLKVFADLEKVLSLKWRCAPWEAFHNEERSTPHSQQLDRLWNAAWGELRTGRHFLEDQMANSGFLELAEAGSHRLSGPSDQVQGKLWCSLSLQEFTWYKEALWGESISSHHVEGPLDDLLVLKISD